MQQLNLRLQARGRINLPSRVIKENNLKENLTIILLPNGIFIPNSETQSQIEYFHNKLMETIQQNLSLNDQQGKNESFWEKVEKDWQQTDQSFIEFDKKFTRTLSQLFQQSPQLTKSVKSTTQTIV